MWMYVEKDGNPSEAGYYYCTLVADVYKNGEPTGQKVAYSDFRNYGDVSNLLEEYRMKDQPMTGLGWIRDLDGYGSESVYAWSNDVKFGMCELPPHILPIKLSDHDD